MPRSHAELIAVASRRRRGSAGADRRGRRRDRIDDRPDLGARAGAGSDSLQPCRPAHPYDDQTSPWRRSLGAGWAWRSTTRASTRKSRERGPTKDEFLAMLGHELRNPLAPIVTALRADGAAGRASRVAQRATDHRAPGRSTSCGWSTICSTSRASRAARSSSSKQRGRAAPSRGRGGRDGEPAARAARAHRLIVVVPDAGLVRRRRPGAAGAGDREPAHQRRQVHRAGRRDRAHRPRTRQAADRRACQRQRHRHRARAAAADLRSVRAGARAPSIASQGGLGHRADDRAEPRAACTAARCRRTARGSVTGSEFVVRLPLPSPPTGRRAAASTGAAVQPVAQIAVASSSSTTTATRREMLGEALERARVHACASRTTAPRRCAALAGVHARARRCSTSACR